MENTLENARQFLKDRHFDETHDPLELDLLAVDFVAYGQQLNKAAVINSEAAICGCDKPKFYTISYHYRKCEICNKREYPQIDL